LSPKSQTYCTTLVLDGDTVAVKLKVVLPTAGVNRTNVKETMGACG